MSADHLLESNAQNYGAAGSGIDKKEPSTHKVNSWALTGGIIIANTCGIASLDANTAFANFGGWLPGSFACTFLIGMNMHMSILVWRLYMCFPEECTFVEVIRAAYSKSSDSRQQLMGNAAGITQYGYTFSCLGLNLMSIGQGIIYVFPTWHVCLPVIMFFMLLATLPFQITMRQVGTWKTLIWLNLVFALGIVLIPMCYIGTEGLDESRVADGKFQAFGSTSLGLVLEGTSSLAFMLTTQYLVVEFAEGMSDAKQFVYSYGMIAIPFQLVILFLVGFGGYYCLGGVASGMLFDYLPFGTTLSLSGCCMVVNALLANLVNGVVICQALHRRCDPEWFETVSVRDWTVWSLIVSGMLFLAWLFANLVPFFTDLCDLLGTTFAPACCYFIPLLAYVRCYFDFRDTDRALAQIRIGEWVLITVEMILTLTMMSYGTYTLLSKIIANWASYGYPFQCHCELLWNTCACSAGRPGMELCYEQVVNPGGLYQSFSNASRSFAASTFAQVRT